MRGSILVNFDELINDRGIDNFQVYVNGLLRDDQFTDVNNYYSTFAFVGDLVIIRVLFTGSLPTVNIVRKDFTTDDEGGDSGIKYTSISPTINTGITGNYSYTFTASTRPDAYNFHYIVDIKTTTPTPTPTPTFTPTPTPTPTMTPTPTPGPTGITPTNLFIYLDANNPSSYNGTGSTWFDLTGNNYDFTLFNNPTFTTSGSTKFFSFDGVNQYSKSVSGATFLNDSSSYTFGAWVYNTTWPSSGGRTFISRNRGTGSSGWSLRLRKVFTTGGRHFSSGFVVQDPTNNFNLDTQSVTTLGTQYNIDQWYYIVGRFFYYTNQPSVPLNSFGYLFINGVEVSTSPVQITGNWPLRKQTGVDTLKGWFICRDETDGTIYTPARIAEVHVYDTDLTDAQILYNFNQTKTKYGY